VLLLTFIAMSFLARKSFCSWLCPVGTLSEAVWKLGQRLLGRNFRIWTWLDWPLRGVKYLLLAFFVKIIFLDMPSFALASFLETPYWAVSDVKMLHFFIGMSTTALAIIAALTLLSFFYQNFWCRYLCPYGALLGLLSMLSPFKVTRSPERCTDCGACSRNCPALIDVQHKIRIHSPECSGCLTCVSNCPEQGALAMAFWQRPVPGAMFVLIVALIFSGGVLAGMLSGYWQTDLTYADYQRLIPLASRLTH